MRHHARSTRVFAFLLTSLLMLSASSPVDAQSDWITRMRETREKAKPKDRLQFLEKAIKEAPANDRPLLQMEKALFFESQNREAEAIVAYDQLLEAPGSLAEYAHLFKGRLLLKSNADQAARNEFEKLVALSPNLQLQNEANFQIARLSLKQGKATEARKLLMNLEKKQRSDAIYADILWELARAEKQLGATGPFCKWVKKLFIQLPESPRMSGWGSDLASQTFDGAPTHCSLNEEERKKRIKNLQWAGMSKKAWDEIEDLRKLPGEDPYEVTLLEALYHLHEGEVSDALNLLLPFYEKKKTNFTYLTTLATTAARSGEPQLAVGSYYAAYKLSPKARLGKQALYQSAFLSYQFQDYDGALRRFQEFMKSYPNSGLAKDARWHLAWIRYLRGDYEGAQKAFEDLKSQGAGKGRKKNSGLALDRIQYWTAMSLYRQGKFVEAKSVFETLVKEGGQSYYALTSTQRLKKLEGLIPKPVRPVLTEQTRRLTRFSSSEFMVPSDDFEGNRWADLPVPEESESEETLVLNPLSSETELAATESNEDEATTEGTRVTINDDAPASGETKSSFSNPVLVRRFERARDLMILGLNDWAKWDLYDIERKTSNKDYLKNLMAEYENIEQFHRSASIAQNAFASLRSQYWIDGIRYVWQHAYPQAYKDHVLKWSGEFQVASELVWGIMKAESSFKRDVVSPVGAIGLMQIMPNTGDKLSGLLKEKGFVPTNLFEPSVSVRLGAKYLQRLMKQFDSNYALTAAGYNAGPHRVRSWMASFGQLDLDEFIEHIPFLETRNYVKRVVANAWVYSQLYNGPKDFFANLAEPIKLRFQNVGSKSKETWEDI